MSCQSIGSGIQRAGLEGGALIGLLAGQIAGKYIVADRDNTAIAIGAKAYSLDGIGAVRRDMKDLLTRQRDLYGPLELTRGVLDAQSSDANLREVFIQISRQAPVEAVEESGVGRP